MSVYVDDMRTQVGNMVLCHMVADTTEELLSMADWIGLERRWIQHEGTYREHFDVSLAKRKKAVKLGAKEVSVRDLVLKVMEKRKDLEVSTL